MEVQMDGLENNTMALNTCRLCAMTGNLCVKVFGEDGEKCQLRQKLRICSPVTVRENDNFPKQVCFDCLSNLDHCYEFYQKVKAAQHTLQARLQKGLKRSLSDNTESQGAKRIKVTDNDSNSSDGQTGSNETSPLFVVMNPVSKELTDQTPKKHKNTALTSAKASSKSGLSENLLGDIQSDHTKETSDPQRSVKDTMPKSSQKSSDGPETKEGHKQKTKERPRSSDSLKESADEDEHLESPSKKQLGKTSLKKSTIKPQPKSGPTVAQDSNSASKGKSIPPTSRSSDSLKESANEEEHLESPSKKQLEKTPLKKSSIKPQPKSGSTIAQDSNSVSKDNTKPSSMQDDKQPQQGTRPSEQGEKAMDLSAIAPEEKLPSATQIPTNKSVPNASSENTSNTEMKVCMLCGLRLPEHKIFFHEALHEGKEVYNCAECDKDFLHKNAFDNHNKRKHKSDKENA